MKLFKIFPIFFSCVFAQNFSAPFDVQAYLGKWYQVYSDLVVQNSFEKGARCVKAFYDTFEPGGNLIEIYNEQIGLNTKIQSIRGYGYIPNEKEPRKLKVVLDQKKEADYWIYELSDIENEEYQWVIVSDKYKVTLFVLARNVDEFYSIYNEKVLQILKDYGFTKIWNKPIQTIQDCSYYLLQKEIIAEKMFRHFCYAVRNFIKAYKENSPSEKPLGRWNWKNCDSSLNNYFANIDSCGDRVCGDITIVQKDIRTILSEKKP